VSADEIDKYVLGVTLSLGGHRQRWMATNRESGEVVIIETLHETMLENRDALEQIRYEIHLSSVLRGPYFMGFIESFTFNNRLYLVWKYIDAISLTNATNLRDLSDKDLAQLIQHIARGLHVAHCAGVIHGALSTDVILVTPSIEPVIIGFSIPGIAPETDPGNEFGISAYAAAAPEIRIGGVIDETSDYFALGIIAQFLINNARMFRSHRAQRHRSSRENTAQNNSIDALIQLLMNENPEIRTHAFERIIDSSFLDEMKTPPQGNEKILMTRSQVRRAKKRDQLRQPQSGSHQQRQKLIRVAISAVIAASIALCGLFIIISIISKN
jgi:serine/threonine protein kinase